MQVQTFSYPHPVLGLSDDMTGEFNCALKVKRDADNRKMVFYDLRFELTNGYVKSLLDANKACLIFKVYCSSTFKTWTFINPEQRFEIDENDLINKAEISVFIVSNETIGLYKDDSFNSQFSDHSFQLNKNEVIAVSGNLILRIEKTDEKQGLGNIFKFLAHDKSLPIQFTYNQDKIHIMYPLDYKGAHPPNNLFKMCPWTAYNIYIVPALAGAFTLALDKKEEFMEFEWYITITEIFPEEEWQPDSFVNAQLLINELLPIQNAYSELLKILK